MSAVELKVDTTGAAETGALGARLGRLLRRGDIIALSGHLGAGKTTFVQGIARGLGIADTVTSPTFVLIARYCAPDGRVLQHADCYRLEHAPAEMWDAGLADVLAGDDIAAVEWADRLSGLLPEERLEVAFEHLDDLRRRLTFTGRGPRGAELLAQLGCPAADGSLRSG